MTLPWRHIDNFILLVADGLEELKEAGNLTSQQIWDQELEHAEISDRELDILAALVWGELAEIISIAIHTPTLAMDLVKTGEWHENDICNGADWQKPKTQETDHEQL